jgi:hypothetical protein
MPAFNNKPVNALIIHLNNLVPYPIFRFPVLPKEGYQIVTCIHNKTPSLFFIEPYIVGLERFPAAGLGLKALAGFEKLPYPFEEGRGIPHDFMGFIHFHSGDIF